MDCLHFTDIPIVSEEEARKMQMYFSYYRMDLQKNLS